MDTDSVPGEGTLIKGDSGDQDNAPSSSSPPKLGLYLDYQEGKGKHPWIGKIPLTLAPYAGDTRLTKVVMDDRSGHDIIYVDGLDSMTIPKSQVLPHGAPL